MKISIDVEPREISKKQVDCYIPKINDVPVMGNGYIIKESISQEGKRFDNIELAKSILNRKVNEINEFMKVNSIFLK